MTWEPETTASLLPQRVTVNRLRNYRSHESPHRRERPADNERSAKAKPSEKDIVKVSPIAKENWTSSSQSRSDHETGVHQREGPCQNISDQQTNRLGISQCSQGHEPEDVPQQKASFVPQEQARRWEVKDEKGNDGAQSNRGDSSSAVSRALAAAA